MSKRVVIADSSPVFRYGLSQILENQKGFQIASHFESGEELERWLNVNEADLIIIDCLAPNFKRGQRTRLSTAQTRSQNASHHLFAQRTKHCSCAPCWNYQLCQKGL